MANRVPTLLATAVAAACSLSAHANGPTQADYAKVVLYSNVTIAQDSTSQWGIWEELEPTAAGPQTPVPLPQITSGTDPYRPLGVVTQAGSPTTPDAPICASGALCGFGVITYQSFTQNPEQLTAAATNADANEAALLNMGFRLTPTAATPTKTFTEGDPAPTNWLPAAMTIETAGIREDNVEQAPKFTAEEIGVMNFRAPNQHATSGTQDGAPSASLSTDTSEFDADATSGKFTGQIMSYVNGGTTQRMANMYGFWGVTASAQDMNNLRLSNAQATYSGSTFGADGASTGSVKMSVNFGTSTFSADFNGGLNVQNPLSGQVQIASNGTPQVVNGALSFNAIGKINGSTFTSSSLQIAGPTNVINGTVQGAFYGSNAAVAAGVADVSAVVTPTGFSAPVYVRYATPFAATKDVGNVAK